VADFELGGEGAGISNGFEEEGTFTLTASTISRNQGTGIFNWSGSITVTASTIADNRGDFAGGIENFDLLTVSTSTISGNQNTNPFLGAGGIDSLGTVYLRNSTVANNTGTGEAANQLSNELGDVFRIRNTILAGDGSRPNVVGTLTSEGHNLSTDASGGLTGPGDLVHTEPRPGPLQGNGGPTLTPDRLPGPPAPAARAHAGPPGRRTS